MSTRGAFFLACIGGFPLLPVWPAPRPTVFEFADPGAGTAGFFCGGALIFPLVFLGPFFF